jgi:hypothetical protein
MNNGITVVNAYSQDAFSWFYNNVEFCPEEIAKTYALIDYINFEKLGLITVKEIYKLYIAEPWNPSSLSIKMTTINS